MNEVYKKLNKIKNNVERHGNKIIQHDKEFERVIGDIKDLKNDRKAMYNLLSSVRDVVIKLTTTVEKLELRLEYEENETRTSKENARWGFRKSVSVFLQILGGLLLAGLIATTIGG